MCMNMFEEKVFCFVPFPLVFWPTRIIAFTMFGIAVTENPYRPTITGSLPWSNKAGTTHYLLCSLKINKALMKPDSLTLEWYNFPEGEDSFSSQTTTATRIERKAIIMNAPNAHGVFLRCAVKSSASKEVLGEASFRPVVACQTKPVVTGPDGLVPARVAVPFVCQWASCGELQTRAEIFGWCAKNKADSPIAVGRVNETRTPVPGEKQLFFIGTMMYVFCYEADGATVSCDRSNAGTELHESEMGGIRVISGPDLLRLTGPRLVAKGRYAMWVCRVDDVSHAWPTLNVTYPKNQGCRQQEFRSMRKNSLSKRLYSMTIQIKLKFDKALTNQTIKCESGLVYKQNRFHSEKVLVFSVTSKTESIDTRYTEPMRCYKQLFHKSEDLESLAIEKLDKSMGEYKLIYERVDPNESGIVIFNDVTPKCSIVNNYRCWGLYKNNSVPIVRTHPIPGQTMDLKVDNVTSEDTTTLTCRGVGPSGVHISWSVVLCNGSTTPYEGKVDTEPEKKAGTKDACQEDVTVTSRITFKELEDFKDNPCGVRCALRMDIYCDKEVLVGLSPYFFGVTPLNVPKQHNSSILSFDKTNLLVISIIVVVWIVWAVITLLVFYLHRRRTRREVVEETEEKPGSPEAQDEETKNDVQQAVSSGSFGTSV